MLLWSAAFSVLVVIFSWQSQYAVDARSPAIKPHIPHVAFVFAGSARSFTEHFVHESIRINLIHSFCPPKLCHGALFFRISLGDNVHQDAQGNTIADGSGRMVPADPNMADEVAAAISRLAKVPGSGTNHSIPTVVTWAEVGTATEKSEIMKDFPSVRSKIFTLLDSRRYSMYYNRHKSFMQVPAYELAHSVEFQWVVHARLDAIWGEPVQPVSFWNSLGAGVNHRYDSFPPSPPQAVPGRDLKVWVVDTWYDDVPDTFALLPRAHAAQYYDVEALAADGVMCLGGPNVNHEQVSSAAHLSLLGFSSEEVEEVKAVTCATEEQGGSETILKRKLEHHKITIDEGTLGYQTFFTAMVRPGVVDDMCFYLEQFRLIGWVWPRQYSNQAVYPACQTFVSLIYQYRKSVRESLASLSALEASVVASGPAPLLSLSADSSGRAFDSKCVLGADGEYSGWNCLLDKAVTDWNFMPFRLHQHGSCLTLREDRSFGMSPCVVNTTYGSDWNSTYSPLQLFHFLPLLRSVQQLQLVLHGGNERIMCLAVGGSTRGSPAALRMEKCYNDMKLHRSAGNDADKPDKAFNQLFLVKMLSSMDVDPWASRGSRHEFITGRSVVAHAKLPTVVPVAVAHVSNHDDLHHLRNWYEDASVPVSDNVQCLTLLPGNASAAGVGAVLLRCDPLDERQQILIERTSTVAWVKYIRRHLDHMHYRTGELHDNLM